jgi:dTDP-4-dehydrorhamnose 3,5-epimerase
MEFIEHEIPGVWEVRPKRFEDARGFFSETYKRSAFLKRGVDIEFVQDNRSLSRFAGTIRGLHFQTPPFAQAKLVSVTRGAILDVAVDIRRGSPTFGRHVAVTLTAQDGAQLLVPEGFAHGFCTLEPDCEVSYKVSAPYSAANDRAILWDDPTLALPWPVTRDAATLSDKDARAPLLADAPELF